MAHTIKIIWQDDTEKEFTIGSDVELPSGMQLTPKRIATLLADISSLINLMEVEQWKSIEIEEE